MESNYAKHMELKSALYENSFVIEEILCYHVIMYMIV
jgi:hypothetical protein